MKLFCGVCFQVERREGVLQPVQLETTVDTSPELDWMTYIRPARDRHEQNVELVLDFRSGNLRLRTSRVVNPGDELLIWYSDQLALDLEVPVLSPTSIRGTAAGYIFKLWHAVVLKMSICLSAFVGKPCVLWKKVYERVFIADFVPWLCGCYYSVAVR